MDKDQVTSNFYFMEEHAPIFLELARNGERVFKGDPNTTLIKMRQLGEALAKDIASRSNINFEPDINQVDLMRILSRELNLDKNIKDIFHTLRKEGNVANHGYKTNHLQRILFRLRTKIAEKKKMKKKLILIPPYSMNYLRMR